jgi:hypothetical protein
MELILSLQTLELVRPNVPVQRRRAAAFDLALNPITVRCNRLSSGSSVRDDDDSNQPQKADKLHEKKREPYRCYGVCMDETYVH